MPEMGQYFDESDKRDKRARDLGVASDLLPICKVI